MKKTKKKKTAKPEMKHLKGHPGLEMDNKGKPIPVAKRLPENRQKVHRASKAKK